MSSNGGDSEILTAIFFEICVDILKSDLFYLEFGFFLFCNTKESQV